MNSLPIELVENILKFLPLKDKLSLEIVCKTWRYILLNNYQNVNGLMIKFEGRKIVHIRCLRDEKFVDNFTDFSKTSKVWCIEDNIRILINRCGIYLRKFEIDFGHIRCFRLSVLNFLLYRCKNLKICKFHGLDVWPISNVKDILNEYRVFGYVSILDTLQDLHLSYPCSSDNHQLCFNISPILSESLQYMARLKKFHLENAQIQNSLFVPLCQKLAPNLEYFCFKENSCNVDQRSLTTGLKSLIKLKHLNLGSCSASLSPRALPATIDDQILAEICVNWENLESLNLHGAYQLTSNGICDLLNSVSGKFSLRHLDLVSCRNVDDTLLEVLKNRTDNFQFLKIYARLTNVSTTMIENNSIRSRRHSFEINFAKTDIDYEKIFFGENCSKCVCDEM